MRIREVNLAGVYMKGRRLFVPIRLKCSGAQVPYEGTEEKPISPEKLLGDVVRLPGLKDVETRVGISRSQCQLPRRAAYDVWSNSTLHILVGPQELALCSICKFLCRNRESGQKVSILAGPLHVGACESDSVHLPAGSPLMLAEKAFNW